MKHLLIVTALLSMPGSAFAQSVLPDDYEEPEPVEEEEEDEEEPVEAPPKPKKQPAKKAEEPVEAKKEAKPRPKLTNRRESSGLGFTLSFGGLGTLRRMTFSGTDHTIHHRPNAYLGGVIDGALHVFTFDESQSHILAEVEGGFGSAKNADVEPALGRPLTTEHAYLEALGVFEKPLHPAVDLRLGLGVSALSYTVEPNPDYTGHRYMSLLTHIGAAYWVSERVKAGGALTFLPGIDTNQSADGYGSARSFGGRGAGYVNWRFLQPDPPDMFGTAEATLRYSYTRFQTTMPETQVLGDLASTSDGAHALVVTVGYNL